MNLLRRYKRHFKLPTRPGITKAQLADVSTVAVATEHIHTSVIVEHLCYSVCCSLNVVHEKCWCPSHDQPPLSSAVKSLTVWMCGLNGWEGRCKPNTLWALPENWRRHPGQPHSTSTWLRNIADNLTCFSTGLNKARYAAQSRPLQKLLISTLVSYRLTRVACWFWFGLDVHYTEMSKAVAYNNDENNLIAIGMCSLYSIV